MNSLVVVTGGCGFIGANLLRALNERGWRNILVVDHLDQGEKWKNLRGVAIEDYLDRGRFLELVEKDALPPCAGVFHLGACSSTVERDSNFLMENNYRYTRTLCEWSLRRQVRLILASSAATYGDGSLGYSDRDEATPHYSPLNMYGFSKHLFDEWALRHGYYRHIVGLKFFNVYGPYEDHKGDMRSVVWKAFHQIGQSGQVSLFRSYDERFRDGEQMRDFVYVRDVVRVMLHFFDEREASGLFNCGTGTARTWLDLAHAVFAAMGVEPRIEFVDMPETLQRKYQCFTQADLKKLRSAGYGAPFTSLEDGVKEYVRDYLLPQYPEYMKG